MNDKASDTDNAIKEKDFEKMISKLEKRQSNKRESTEKTIIEFFKNKKEYQKTVLGFDIYGYSKYEEIKQRALPLIFYKLYQESLDKVLENSIYFNALNNHDLPEAFINTGDGGFQILHTPIHAILLLKHFHFLIHSFNTGKICSPLRSYIGRIDIRYAITMGNVNKVEHEYYENYYGDAIIKNSRIMAKDKLNRLLIDEDTYNWFLSYTNGIENIENINNNELLKMQVFKEYHDENSGDFDNLCFFQDDKNDISKIKNCELMKIGEIETKGDKHSIYNVSIKFNFFDKETQKKTIITIGNTNTSGLSALWLDRK